jgi:hypothetical protein
MSLDLSIGSQIFIPVEGAVNYKAKGQIVKKKKDGNYIIMINEECESNNSKSRVSRLLGDWWIREAINGTIPQLPIINLSYFSEVEENNDNSENICEQTVHLPNHFKLSQSHFAEGNSHKWDFYFSMLLYYKLEHVSNYVKIVKPKIVLEM